MSVASSDSTAQNSFSRCTVWLGIPCLCLGTRWALCPSVVYLHPDSDLVVIMITVSIMTLGVAEYSNDTVLIFLFYFSITAEAANNNAGFGIGQDEKGQVKWNFVSNANIYKVEVSFLRLKYAKSMIRPKKQGLKTKLGRLDFFFRFFFTTIC